MFAYGGLQCRASSVTAIYVEAEPRLFRKTKYTLSIDYDTSTFTTEYDTYDDALKACLVANLNLTYTLLAESTVHRHG